MIQKRAEGTDVLIVIGVSTDVKIADKITSVSKTSPQNNSDTNEEEILRKRYVSPELRHEIVDDLRLIHYNTMIEYQKVINILDDTKNQPSKFRTRNWTEINE